MSVYIFFKPLTEDSLSKCGAFTGGFNSKQSENKQKETRCFSIFSSMLSSVWTFHRVPEIYSTECLWSRRIREKKREKNERECETVEKKKKKIRWGKQITNIYNQKGNQEWVRSKQLYRRDLPTWQVIKESRDRMEKPKRAEHNNGHVFAINKNKTSLQAPDCSI